LQASVQSSLRVGDDSHRPNTQEVARIVDPAPSTLIDDNVEIEMVR
jgi:hypothetical protein